MNTKVRYTVSIAPDRPGLEQGDIVRPSTTASRIEPLIGATSAQGGVPTVALPSDQPGHPEPGLAAEQEGAF